MDDSSDNGGGCMDFSTPEDARKAMRLVKLLGGNSAECLAQTPYFEPEMSIKLALQWKLVELTDEGHKLQERLCAQLRGMQAALRQDPIEQQLSQAATPPTNRAESASSNR